MKQAAAKLNLEEENKRLLKENKRLLEENKTLKVGVDDITSNLVVSMLSQITVKFSLGERILLPLVTCNCLSKTDRAVDMGFNCVP